MKIEFQDNARTFISEIQFTRYYNDLLAGLTVFFVLDVTLASIYIDAIISDKVKIFPSRKYIGTHVKTTFNDDLKQTIEVKTDLTSLVRQETERLIKEHKYVSN